MSFYETVAAAGVKFREGQVNGLTCPKCDKANVNLKVDKHWATCFTAGCDFKFRGEHQNKSNWVIKFFEVLAEDWLAHFRGDGGEAAREVLIQQRHIHPAVLKRLPIGCIPPGYDLKRAIQAAKAALVDDEEGWAEEVDANEERPEGAEQRKKFKEFLQGSKRTGKDGAAQGCTLQELVHSLAGWWAFLYQDKNGDYIAANLRCPWKKQFFKIQPLERMGIFAPMDANEPKPDLYADCKGELLCFEGEINHLQFLSQIVCEAFQANPGAEEVSLANRIVPSCALGGVSSWDLETLSGYTLNPVFCYDNDGPDKGITGVEKASLFTNKHGDNLTVLAFTTPTKDADDFFRGGGNLKQFSELWRSARKLTVPLAVVRERIDEMRRSVKRKNGPMKYQVEQTIAEFVWKDLNERGRFFHSGGLGLIFLDGDKEPIEISGDGDKFCNLMIDYGLYPADQLKHFVGRFLGPQATRYGTKTDLHLLSYYDKQQNTVWLSEYDGNVLRITPQSIQRVPNGTDGVLFKLPEGAEPYKVNLANITGENLPMRYRYGLLLSSGSAIHRFITSTVQYQENNLTTVQYERLYLALLMTLFMPGLFHTKPLVMFLGESGSGKTMLGERAGWLLRGSKFAAVDMPEKKEDLENLITNTPFAVIDNVGKLKSTAFQSLLAIAATGGAATKRELYSTNKQVETACRLTCGYRQSPRRSRATRWPTVSSLSTRASVTLTLRPVKSKKNSWRTAMR